MPSTKWSVLRSMQLGRYAEYYAKMEFASYGYDVYTSEVDDHGVDFIARDEKTNIYYEVQVKSLLKGNYSYIPEPLMDCKDEKRLVCFLKFTDGSMPDVFIIPATAWQNLNEVLVYRKYNKPGQKSKPEWGIACSKKNLPLLEKYRADKFLDI